MNDILPVLIPAAAGVFGVLGSSFWTSRWINKTDKKLDDIGAKLNDMSIKDALHGQAMGEIKAQYACMQDRVGKVETKVWGFMHAKTD